MRKQYDFSKAKKNPYARRLKKQITLRIDETLRPLYGIAVRELALTGSDPFLREGADVTLMLHLRERLLFEDVWPQWDRGAVGPDGA